MTIPIRLAAATPGWNTQTDVIVVGSGIAGLTTALQIAKHSSLRITLVTKDVLSAGSTRWAQGGIAAALGTGDTPEQHLTDTLVAGAGICNEDAVRILVREGPAAVRDLVALGARFDRGNDGDLSLTREGGHHRDRIAHAGGDATGVEIERALVARLLDASGIDVIEHALVLDLLKTASGAVAGVTVHVMGEGQRDGVGSLHARAVVLATGGIGQVYASTTNPSVSTGDGVAAAIRAGVVVRDLEFVQFHPTVAWLGKHSRGQQPLVSEAVRGEGAFLQDDSGVRFMQGQHELVDLAPRDVVAKAILRRMHETGAEHMWLNATRFGTEKWRVRFPTIYSTLTSLGIDPAVDLIPVVPASHYASGGVRTDIYGRSSIPGLFACGETACTGVHGANRLASNSLLEGLVFGRRIASTIVEELVEPRSNDSPIQVSSSGSALDPSIRPELQCLMSENVGVLRDADGLNSAAKLLDQLGSRTCTAPGTESWEATNLHAVATALVAAAQLRTETRGSHWREDFADRDDAHWDGHLDTTIAKATMSTVFVADDLPQGIRS